MSSEGHHTAADDDAGNAYRALAETTSDGDPRWAFGSGFDSGSDAVEAEITSPVPDGVDAADLAAYCLMLGDDALICSQRLAEWVAAAPELEEEVALANIALDLLGQARVLLSRAGHVEGRDSSPMDGTAVADEDALAYFRDERALRNVTLAEVDGGDFGRTIARLLVFSSWRLALLQRLTASRDPVLAAVAGKGVKEVAYHRDYAARWTLRLGDGTAVSRQRMQAGLDGIWPHVESLFTTHDVERRLAHAGVAADPGDTRADVDAVLDEVLGRATLHRPDVPAVGLVAGRGGRDGVHTEALGHLLAEMQSLARIHPEAAW
ncbi:MAG: phenylacetate-CoA oxygenase subunit PaaC [Pseudonocardiaceae bacterium]|nr:phenylacetate-CoA oxygenase subunit PaaC [Pseudonocardiaceae bacterium]